MTLLSHRDMYAGKFGLPVSARFQHSENEIRRAVEEVHQQHPELAESEANGRALARLDAQKHALQPKAILTKQHNWRRWIQVAVFVALLLAVIVLSSLRACAQIDVIKWQNQGSGIGVFAAPFTVNFTGAGVVCSRSNSVVTCTVTGGSITNNPGGSNTQIQFNDSAAFGGSSVGTYLKGSTKFQFQLGTHFDLLDSSDTSKAIEFDASSLTTATTRTVAFPDANSRTIKNGSSTGQIPIWNNSTSTFDVSDPLIQGTQAAASTTIPNPVVIGGSDFGGTPAVRIAKVDSSGNLFVGNFPASQPVTGTFWQATQPVSGTFWQATQPVSGTFWQATQPTSIADGSDTTLGAKADAKSTATDTTAISAMSVLKQISASVQAPPSQAVTNAGTFAVQAATTIADGADTTLGAKGDAKSTATDTTAVSAISVLKEISALEQAPASRAVTNAGTFADQATLQTQTDTTMVGGVNVKEINGVAPLMGNGGTGTGSQRVTIASDNTAFAVNATLSAETTKVIGTVRAQGNLGAAFDAATGAAPPANAVLAGGLGSGATGGDVIAIPVGDTYKNINISTATTTLLVTGVASRQVRITALHMVTALANNVALIEGTGATCGTGTAGMAGGTTAASGYNLAANGGMTLGSGLGTVIATVTTGDSVCAVTSASTQLSGGIEYAIY